MKNCKTGPKFYYEDIQKYTGICFQSNSRMQFLRVKKRSSAIAFSDTKKKKKKKMLARKFVKGDRFLAVLREHVILNVE